MRNDNDTWDITTSVGSTALFVAAARALEAQKPHPIAVDPFAETFCRAVGGEWADLLDGRAPDHPLRTDDFGTAFVDFQAVRTRYFDNYFRAAADAGVRQIVLLAAGLDSRAYRARGWRAEATRLEDWLSENGRPVPEEGSEAATMTGTISLVSAVKA
ncbi:methyltransferase [Mycolicibacterium flavescens]|nr:SAM-dependent methyltransferase [Mycobacterium neumannii]VEG46307.1 methyltransferase [Mycolicibacterium flavescens]